MVVGLYLKTSAAHLRFAKASHSSSCPQHAHSRSAMGFSPAGSGGGLPGTEGTPFCVLE
ncbi:hypothetical protein F443_21777 [Phytophthora nicotianae P1569]|uniref:Uncharacterized protein n=1 Tax=Phytophthora nicotianae P1569 TaxID=1317065 RepID=V9DWF6_PHYNI|nr:hypothetical protein F443_21777 [Phytophthora nicotianae P1569]